jgi:hypothetical protein
MNKRDFERKRKTNIEKLIAVSTLEERNRIKEARKVGRLLRKEVEKL